MSTHRIDQVKHTKKIVYFLLVYCLPFFLALAIGVGVFYMARYNYLQQYDELYSYLIILLLLLLATGILKKAFIKMPNKKLYKIKKIQFKQGFLISEPAVYEIEYFAKNTANVFSIVIGLVLLAIGYLLLLFSTFSYLMPLFIMLVGLLAIIFNFIFVFNKQAVLKLTKHGLWTKQLQFVDWKEVEKIESKLVGNFFSKKRYLLIYISKTYFCQSNMPDQYLLIQNIQGYSYIETVSLNLMRNRKENLVTTIL